MNDGLWPPLGPTFGEQQLASLLCCPRCHCSQPQVCRYPVPAVYCSHHSSAGIAQAAGGTTGHSPTLTASDKQHEVPLAVSEAENFRCCVQDPPPSGPIRTHSAGLSSEPHTSGNTRPDFIQKMKSLPSNREVQPTPACTHLPPAKE